MTATAATPIRLRRPAASVRRTQHAAPRAAASPIAPKPTAPTPAAPTPHDLTEHRAAMLRFARRKIRDEDLAEDAVQDALAAALVNRESFQGQSALRTWLIGILNHKIQDTFRREGRYVSISGGTGADDESAEEELDRIAFNHDADYEDPLRQVARKRLGEALHSEIDALPPTLKDVFVMQVLEGIDTSEVCRELSITEANCWVRLHRARKRLSERMSAHLV
jgi:RNA polymerase sigma-70 factor, ECF subfamily